jgi:hypothetical protein
VEWPAKRSDELDEVDVAQVNSTADEEVRDHSNRLSSGPRLLGNTRKR